MAKSKKSQFGTPVTFWQQKYMLSVTVFALLFGGAGVYTLAKSGAAPKHLQPTHVIVTDYKTVQAIDPTVAVIQDTVNYVAAPQTVVALQAGSAANFGPNKGGGVMFPTQTCYYLRAVGAPAQVVVTSGTNQKTVTINNDLNWYEKVCVSYTSAGTLPGFSIKNVSGGQLNVYQQVLEFRQS